MNEFGFTAKLFEESYTFLANHSSNKENREEFLKLTRMMEKWLRHNRDNSFVTIHTARAVIRLYGKMFGQWYRPTLKTNDRIISVCQKYGRKNVCVVFRFVKAKTLYGFDLDFILCNFQGFLNEAYCNNNKKGGIYANRVK